MLKHRNPSNEPSLDLLVELGYETRDVAFKTIGLWIFGLIAFALSVAGVMLLAFRWFAPDVTAAQYQRAYPLATTRRLPQEPMLQADPRRDMAQYHAKEDRSILEWQYTDPNKKTGVNVPIDVAIEKYASEVGISGVKGTATPPVSSAYPGSGRYENRPARTTESDPMPKPGATAPPRLGPNPGERGESPMEYSSKRANTTAPNAGPNTP